MKYIQNVRLLRHHAEAKHLRIRKDGDVYRVYTELPRCQLGDGLVGPVDFYEAAEFVSEYASHVGPSTLGSSR